MVFNSSAEESAPKLQAQPNNRDAEESVLGAILINPEAFYEVSQYLRAEDFYYHKNKCVWEAFTSLNEKNSPIDPITVKDELERKDQLIEIGGIGYLAELSNKVPNSLHAETYAKRVEEASTRRNMIAAAEKIASQAYSDDLELSTAIENSEKAIFSVSDRLTSKDVKPINQVLDDYSQAVYERRALGLDFMGIPTGFTDLDRMLSGLQKSDLMIIAGRPGQGKTSFMLSLAKNIALDTKKHVVIFSMEMSNEQLTQRLISQHAGIDSNRLRVANLDEHEWNMFDESVQTYRKANIHLDDTPALTPTQIRAKCRRLHQEHPIDLILIDYLQLMSTERRIDNRVQEVSLISRNLKILARELDVPVMAAAQLSRAVMQRADKKPMLSDLRESGSLEQDADIVMFIYRPEDATSSDDKNSDQEDDQAVQKRPENDAVHTQILVAKHRNGPTGAVDLLFWKNQARFVNAAFRERDLNE